MEHIIITQTSTYYFVEQAEGKIRTVITISGVNTKASRKLKCASTYYYQQ